MKTPLYNVAIVDGINGCDMPRIPIEKGTSTFFCKRKLLPNDASHITSPFRFIFPDHKNLQPAWFISLGLFYNIHFGERNLLPGTSQINQHNNVAGQLIKKSKNYFITGLIKRVLKQRSAAEICSWQITPLKNR